MAPAVTGNKFLNQHLPLFYILFPIDVVALDVAMLSLLLMGSSRTSGGLYHGCAHGNIPKHADLTTVDNDFKVPVKGDVHLYITDQYPQNVNFEHLRGDSDLVVIVNVTNSMALIPDMVFISFPLSDMCDIYLSFIYFDIKFRRGIPHLLL